MDVPPVSHDAASAKLALHKAKAKLKAREISPDTYSAVEDEVRQSKVFAPGLQLSSLLEVPHTEPGDNPSIDGEMETKLGFLDPDEEAKYLGALDSQLGDSTAITPLKTNQPSESSTVDTEKEAALQNPVSVYNWLRKHQPHVFLQDNEPNPEKPPSRPSNAKGTKRKVRKEEDFYDEDGIALDLDTVTVASNSRGKRKRDEDGGYRPKGGSSRPSKKRKEKDDAPYSGKRAK